jgi:hypothetical protein
VGGYVQNLATKYLIFSVAGLAFLAAIIFGMLAIFWVLAQAMQDYPQAAGIMAGIMLAVGCFIALVAYGIAQRPPRIVRHPVESLEAQLPTVDDIGDQIEWAARRYGPVKVLAAAGAAGLVAGVAARKFGANPLRDV